MKQLIHEILVDAASQKDIYPLRDLVHYLLFEKEIPLERVEKMAYVHFGIPSHVLKSTLEYLM